MDANEMYDSSVVELNNQVISDTRETKEEQERFLLHEETDSDDIPSSLLSYFETSKSRAAVCEKLVLEDLEDLDVINLPFELDKDMMTPSEQVTSDSENEESNIPTDTRLSVCPINEDEFMESETLLALEYEAERDKTQHEEMKKEEQRRQTERDFQEQLKKILEAEKLHQKELELKGKRAQEKLEEELLLQQELISNLQKQVENERRMREEEQKRMKDEKDKREEAERKRMEEEMRRKKEEERKIEEMKLKKEEERKREAEERRRMEREEKKKKEEERKKLEDEMRIKEEERKNKEERDRKRREEEEEKEEARKRENIKNMKEKKEVKEVVRKEEENTNIKEDQRPIEEDEKRKREDGKETKKEEQRRQKEERRQEDEEGSRKSDEEIKIKENEEGCKRYDFDSRKMKHDSKTNNKEKKQDEEEDKKLVKEEERKNVEAEEQLVGENKKEVNNNTGEEIRLKEKESKKRAVQKNNSTKTDETGSSLMSQLEDGTTWTSSRPRPLHSESTTNPTSTETPPQHDPEENISPTSVGKTVDCVEPSTGSLISPMSLPELTEKKRLAWMKDCVSWSKLSLQNRRKQKASVRSRRGLRGAAEAGSLPPLCPDALLQSSGWRSLQEVTTVTLEDLPGCSLSTLTQCSRLQSLTLRRCGLRSLEGINQLAQLCYIDVQENDISFINCENMSCLRVLRLGHNKLTSIHGLTGAENVDVLDLSHNSITRIAGLESMRRLQRLSVDHNQLISTKGLRDVYTLLHLNCSHNHLVRVEGLENSALLSTLDLRANSLTEPPSLNNQVLLRELHLDDNSISSLQGLTACWLPLMQHLSVAQNRITQLPSMSDSVSLANLDLRFNCLSELQNVCESLEGCLFLREVHLTGNPFQQENGWRSTLQKAAPGLRAIDDLETDSLLTPPAVQQVSLASGSFLTFCQAQLQQTRDLQQQLSRELSNASSSLDAVQTSCQHFTEALQLAKDQRFAHEYGDTTVADEPRAAGQTTHEDTVDMDSTKARKSTGSPDMESTGNARAVLPNRDRCSWTFEDKSAAESRHDTLDPVTTEPTVSKANSDSVHFSATKIKTSSSNPETAPLSNHPDLDLQNTAAVVIQQLWRKYRQKCGNISSFSTAEEGGRGGGGRGGDGGKPESGPSYINSSVVGQDYAATVIQALWRGFSLRRRLASALAAVTCPDTGEDDTFEEVDVDEFVFDEALLEKQWTMSLPEDSPPRCSRMSEQPLSLKPLGHFPEPSQYILPPPPVWRPKQAWVPGEHVDSAGQRVSPESSNRGKSPASTSVLSGLSERSEKIVEEWGFTDSQTALLMLKRAQKMKSTKQQQKKHPSVRLAVFRNCSYQLGPVEARNKPAQYNRNDRKVGEAELGLQQAEKMERVKQERAKQWLHTQAAHTDQERAKYHQNARRERVSVTETVSIVHFLPEISPDVLNGGRVQLVADPGYTKRLHHASGLWANSSSAAEASCKESNYPRRNSVGHARKEVPTPQRVTSAPSKKERISHRDNPVQLSGGWGGGKKRDKVYK